MTDSGRRWEDKSVRANGRRTFIKSLVTAIGGIATSSVARGAASRPATPHDHDGLPAAAPPWRRTIYCQFDTAQHRTLLDALLDCARETDCETVLGTNGHPDIFAYGCLVQVIGQNCVGEELWREYAAAYEHAGDITPCFIIDDRRDLPLPDWRFAWQVDITDPGATPTIVETIRQMKAEMNRRLPAFFKNGQDAVETPIRTS